MQGRFDFDGILEKMQQIQEELERRLPDIAATLVLSGKALAERNIVDKGFGKKYSPNPVPVWYFKGKDLNQQGRDFIDRRTYVQGGGPADVGAEPDSYASDSKKKKKGDKKPKAAHQHDGSGLATWSEFRQVQVLQVAHVDLHYSNKMFAGLGLAKVEQKGKRYIAYLGGTNRETVDKMNWNYERYGNFLGQALTDADFQILNDIVIEEVQNLLNQFR